MVAIISLTPISRTMRQVSDAANGFFSYRVLPTTMDRHPLAAGYLVINDDSILSYWNLRDANLTKIWFLREDVTLVGELGKPGRADWCFTEAYQKTVAEAFKLVPLPFLMKLRRNAKRRFLALNVDPKKACLKQVTDLYYIPNRHVAVFKELSQYFLTARVYSEASTTISYFLLDNIHTRLLVLVCCILSDPSWYKITNIRD